MSYIKVCLLLLGLFCFPLCYHAEAAFVIKKKASYTEVLRAGHMPAKTLSQSYPREGHPKMAIAQRLLLMYGGGGDGKGNSRGIASLLCVGLFVTALVAVTIVTPTIPDSLALMLVVLGFASSVSAVVLGARGLKRDRNRGYAVTGLVLGIGLLFIEVLIGFVILAFTGGAFL